MTPLAHKAVVSVILHVTIICSMLLWSCISCRERSRASLTPFVLQAGGPGPAGDGGASATPAASAPAAPPVVAFAKPEGLQVVEKTAPAKSKPAPKPKAKKVVPQESALRKPSPTAPSVSQTDIQKMLGSAVKNVGTSPGATGSGPGLPGSSASAGVYDPHAWYYILVKNKMYEAWQQPGSLSSSKGLLCVVLVRVARDGEILKFNLDCPSGNSLMDQSALQAVEQVRRLPPLPAGLGGTYKDITISFTLTD